MPGILDQLKATRSLDRIATALERIAAGYEFHLTNQYQFSYTPFNSPTPSKEELQTEIMYHDDAAEAIEELRRIIKGEEEE